MIECRGLQIHQIQGTCTVAGVLDEREREELQAPIIVKVRQLELQGPVWRAPSVREVGRWGSVPRGLTPHIAGQGFVLWCVSRREQLKLQDPAA